MGDNTFLHRRRYYMHVIDGLVDETRIQIRFCLGSTEVLEITHAQQAHFLESSIV